MKTKILFMIGFAIMSGHHTLKAQSTVANGAIGNQRVAGRFLGWNTTGTSGSLEIRNDFNQPINFSTNTFQRMTILGGPPNVLGGGFIGMGTATPVMPLTIQGRQQATQVGWDKGLLLSDFSVLMWFDNTSGNNRNFFMAYPDHPEANFWEGTAAGIGAGAAVNYSRKVWTNTLPSGATGPLSSTQIFKNLYVAEIPATAAFARRMAINTLNPTNILQIKSFVPATTFNPLTSPGADTRSGLRFENLTSTMTQDAMDNTAPSHTTPTVLSVNEEGDVILVRDGGGAANNGTSISTISAGTVVLGQNINQALNPAALINDREIPMSNRNLIFTTNLPDIYPGKVGFGIAPGNIGVNALRTTPITMQVNGSISIFDGTGNTSIFFGEEQHPFSSGILGEWGMQYWAAGPGGGGMNFWKPFGSGGVGFGNKFLYLCNNGNVGIGATGTAAPGNALEITSYPTSPQPAGLRFTNLTSAGPFGLPNGSILTVDQNGDVILAPGGTGAIGTCILPTVFPLNISGAIDLSNNNNFYFLGNSPNPTGSNVVIGKPCGVSANAKLDVFDSRYGRAGEFAVDATLISPSVQQVALIASISGGTSLSRLAMAATSTFSSTIPQSLNTGILSAAGNATNNRAIHAYTTGAGTNNFGILASCFGASYPSIVGNYAGVFNGNVYSNMTFNTPSWTSPSDRQIKKDTISFTNGLSTIRNIRPISYRFNGKVGYDTVNTHIGVIAEDLATIAPYAIDTFYAKLDSTDSESIALLGVKNEAIIYTSINAIKQLDSALTKSTSVPDAPILISPADGTVGDFRGATFTWHSVSVGIILYHAQMATDNSFSNIILDQSGIADTTFSAGICDTLPPVTYYWRVNAKNNAGTGAWSNVFSFTDTAKCKPIGPGGPKEPGQIGSQTAVSFNSSSDSRFKTNIAPVTDALNKVSQLNGVYYDWVHTNPNYSFDSTQQIGFIAQDVQAVIPEVVHTDTNGFYSLDYGRLVPVLVEAVKELKAWKDSVQNATARTIIPENDNRQHAELTSPTAILYVNIPNPFKDETTIGYYVPENAGTALMTFFDETGSAVKEVELLKKGNNSLVLSTNKLASGIYSYSLIVDGRVIDTKKMLKTK